jgi:hypothetical protein
MTTRSATPADVEAALLAATEPGPITGDPLLAHQHAALGTRRRREAARVHPLQQPLAEIATHLRHRVGGDTRTAVHASNHDSSFRPGEVTPVGRSEGEVGRSAVAPLRWVERYAPARAANIPKAADFTGAAGGRV